MAELKVHRPVNEKEVARAERPRKESDVPVDPSMRYRFLSSIGAGSFGGVWKAVDTQTGDTVAIKVVRYDGTIPHELQTEVEIMQKFHHKNIVQFKDAYMLPTEMHIVMEYVDGLPLHHYLVAMGENITEDLVFHFFYQILCAVYEIHCHNICHRDLKLENILVTPGKIIKIIDFGFSKETVKEPSTPCGSPHYAAPEIDTSNPYNGQKADMWSLGVVLYAILFRMLPFRNSENTHIRRLVKSSALEFPKKLPTDMESLLFSLLNRNPTMRFSCMDVMNHPYWKTMYNTYISPNTRRLSQQQQQQQAQDSAMQELPPYRANTGIRRSITRLPTLKGPSSTKA